MGKITNRPQADTSNLPSGYISKGSLVQIGLASSGVKEEHYGQVSGQPVNYDPVSSYRDLPYSELSELASALCEQSHRMESNLSTLDCTLDTTNQHEDSVSSTVRDIAQDSGSLLHEPNSMLVRMLHMTVKEEQSWLGALGGSPCSGSPSSSRASASPPPESPCRALAGASPLAVSEEATLGDAPQPSETPLASRSGPDFHNLQTALRALIKEVTQATPQDQHCSPAGICGVAKSLLSADSSSNRSTGIFPPPVSMVTKGGIARRVNQVAKRPTLYMSFPSRSRRGDVELKILSQPEEQHRARYLTEGSRGAVKDRTGMGFPTVKLTGLQEQVKLQVFIGTDQGKVQPHMFYQASRVCGKNSTPCQERRLDGTTVLEIDMLPSKDMTVSCDCVGILKERNVDVEKRLVRYGGTRNKKRSTKCRLVFRVVLPAQRGQDTGGLPSEILQVASAPILCTQPPGIPEISKKSLSECSVKGDVELFIIGKNFLKDTKVLFKEPASDNLGDCEPNYVWEKCVVPEKEYLQPTHLICRVPAYRNQDVGHLVVVHLVVTSGGRASEPHPFTYMPLAGGGQISAGPLSATKAKPNANAATASGLELKPQPFGSSQGAQLPTIIQIPLLAGTSPRAQRHPVQTLVIPTTTIALSPASASVPESQSKPGTCSGAAAAAPNNIQFVVVQQPAQPTQPQTQQQQQQPQQQQSQQQQQPAAPATLSLVVSSAPQQTLLKAVAEDISLAESCHLKRKISHAPEGAPDKCAANYELSGEEPLKASDEQQLGNLGLFYTDQSMLPPCSVDQLMGVTTETGTPAHTVAASATFECESQWSALTTAHQNQTENAAKPLWGQMNCESASTEPDLEGRPPEMQPLDNTTASFADEQQFKKQKVKDVPVLSLSSWPASSLEQQVQSMDFTCAGVKTEVTSSWSDSLNGMLTQSEPKVPVVFGDKVIMDPGPVGVNTAPSAQFSVTGTFDSNPQCQDNMAAAGAFGLTSFEAAAQPVSQPQTLVVEPSLGVSRDQAPQSAQQAQTQAQGPNMDHISAMSMLPESELLRMINPNAFDNV
ncbi:uncharacterized protein [Dermacentor andersoni]|uniref:uncharacterized protein n=1 Tax=Dermacentor andersoni TaxID=34620 RepID=UPI002155AC1C|nr:nuclear factor of activated T-cells 5-like [Dermacentor andersoni]XP_050048219.1 nuclear factor of activated T-cells 5-like [Dermacentor andersoni]